MPERKIIISSITLVCLVAGVFVIAYANRSLLFGKAQISQIFENRQTNENPPSLSVTGYNLVQSEFPNIPSPADTETLGENATTPPSKAAEKPEATEEKSKPQTNWCQMTDYYARQQVIFNEIAWMGTRKSYTDEWIELKNISADIVNLEGWQLQNKKRTISIVFPMSKTIGPGGLFLLERSDDNAVDSEKADFIYSGSMANSKEELLLFDNNCVLQDRLVAGPNWLGGNNSTKQTMERTANLFWQTSELAGGTPKKENSGGSIIAATGTAGGANNPLASPPVFINEIMYDPPGSDDHREWVEIYNNGDEAANLEDWKFMTGGVNHSLSVLRGSFILPAQNFAIITNAADVQSFGVDEKFSGNIYKASFSLRNTTTAAEQILLKNGDNVIDQAVYESSWGANGDGKSLQRKDFVRTGDDGQNWEAQVPTQGFKNIFTAAFSPIVDNATTTLENATSTIDNATTTPDIILNPPADNSTSTVATDFSVVINEIAWMGTATSTYDEWIELYNNATSTIDLAGWRIDKDGSSFVSFNPAKIKNATTTIDASGFYLLERTDDDTVPGIKADLIYTGSLPNNGAILELFDRYNNLIDACSCNKNGNGVCVGWFAGNNDDKSTMVRKFPLGSGSESASWQNSSQSNGTPKSPNH